MMRQESHSSILGITARLCRVALGMIFVLLLGGGASLRADDTTRQVQEELRKRNLYFGDVDGCRSPQLIAAVRRYQERKDSRPRATPTIRPCARSACARPSR